MSSSVLIEKFQRLEVCLSRIELKVHGDPASLDSEDIQDIFVLNLQRAVQIVLDVATHLLKTKDLKIPGTMKEYFIVLADHNIIDRPLAERLAKMVGFRNIAVHNYEKLNLNILKAIYSDHLDDLLEFKRQILRSC